tara:strand:- start:136 stop:1014 length:879 start_codon:yes stop_codon:yes gene_type:complete
VLKRVSRDGTLPHWYDALQSQGALPNLDGKTIGSVVEMLLVGALESADIFEGKIPPLSINPARGVDIPSLDLGVKSPSENYCTSEPFFSAYERLLGGEYDALILLTDYQKAKKSPPLRLQIIGAEYLTKTQVADANLCSVALMQRGWLLETNESWTKKLFRFLAYVNQSDWRANQLLKLVKAMQNEDEVLKLVSAAEKDFEARNKKAAAQDRDTIPDAELAALKRVRSIAPTQLGVIDECDNWVMDNLKEAARAPSAREWHLLREGPLDGKIGMSFALQWRYNFGRLFRDTE